MPLSVPPVRAPAPLLVPLLPQVVPVPGCPALGDEGPLLSKTLSSSCRRASEEAG